MSQENCSKSEQSENIKGDAAKKTYATPTLTKYGTVKDVYRGPSCKSVLSNADDK